MEPTAAPWVDAGPFRAHLRHLMEVGGLSATEVAVLAAVPPRMATSLAEGRGGRPLRRIRPEYARALLLVGATHVRSLRERQVPAAESRLRLRRLLARAGCPSALAQQLGVPSWSLEELAEETAAWCSALLALRLLTACRTVPGAEEGRVERFQAAA